jgi:hypothetical protein
MGANDWLSALNFGASAGGAAGSAETTSTLGTDRLDLKEPSDQYHIGGLQITRMKNLLINMTEFSKGGTRVKVLRQTSNPFSAGEVGFYVDNSGDGNPKFVNAVGTTSTLLTGATVTLQDAYTNGSSGSYQDIQLTSTDGAIRIRNASSGVSIPLVVVDSSAGTHYFNAGVSGGSGYMWATGARCLTLDGGSQTGSGTGLDIGANGTLTTALNIGRAALVTAVVGGLSIAQSLRVARRTGTTTPITTTATDHIVGSNMAMAAAVAVNLHASPATGTVLHIKDEKGDAGSNNITITPAAGNIDGAGTKVINSNYGSATLYYNGTQWFSL